MEFIIKFNLEEPQASIFASLLAQRRKDYIQEAAAKFVSDLVVQELVNVMDHVNQYNIGLTISAEGSPDV